MPPQQRHDTPSQREDSQVPAGESTAPPRANDAVLRSRAPTVLGLARLLPQRRLSRAGIDLFRHIARMVELGPEREFVLVPSGSGASAIFLAESTGADGAGVDPEPGLVDLAVARVRNAQLADRLHFEEARLDDLPYQDAVFDVAIGDLGLSGAEDPVAAVRELVRVTKPTGAVVLIQLTWTGSVPPERRDALAEFLGARPLLLVEWKQVLREAGVVDLYVEDWSEATPILRQPGLLAGLAELGSIRDRLVVLFRAWRQWGWRGLWMAIRSGAELHTLLTQDRVLGLSLIRGTRAAPPAEPDA